MIFYIDTVTIKKIINPLFGKQYIKTQLASICIICENGNRYYAASNQFRLSDLSQEVQMNLFYLSSGIRKTPNQIAQEVNIFMSYNAANEDIKVFYFKHSTIDSFANIFAGIPAPKYPSHLLNDCILFPQYVVSFVTTAPEELFRNDSFRIAPPIDEPLNEDMRFAIYHSHSDLPEPSLLSDVDPDVRIKCMVEIHNVIKSLGKKKKRTDEDVNSK